MKKTILTLLTFLPLLLFSQKKQKEVTKVILPLKNESIYIEKVIDSLSADKRKVYNASLKWMATVFVDSKEVIQNKNENDGEIIGSGNFRLVLPGFTTTNDLISFMIEITAKDNKSRMRIYQFSRKAIGYNYPSMPLDPDYQAYLKENQFPKANKKYYEAFKTQVDLLLSNYESFLKENVKPDDF